MQSLFAVTFPFFALVLAGYLAAKTRTLPEAAIPGLNSYVLFFALPCMLFRFGLNTPLPELLNPVVLLVWLVSALIIVASTVAFSRNTKVGLKDASFGALVASFSNTGFMGVPLLLSLLGASAAGPMMSTILIDLFITSSLCIALAQAAGAGARDSAAGVRAAVWRAMRGALSNPLPWAIAAGVLAAGLNLRPAGPLQTAINMLGDSASPVALFTIGAVLCRAGRHAHSQTRKRDYVPVALVKLLLHPALVFGLCTAAQAAGLPLTAFQTTVLTLVAALPSASNVAMLAERYGADNGRIARIILFSTVLAFVSFTGLAWVFGASGRAV
jgi:malonate transporter and related proteins